MSKEIINSLKQLKNDLDMEKNLIDLVIASKDKNELTKGINDLMSYSLLNLDSVRIIKNRNKIKKPNLKLKVNLCV